MFDRLLGSRKHISSRTTLPQVAAVHLVSEPFSVENGLMTPTFKIKRPQAKAAFQEAIAAMYARLKE
jgi:long-subunit acyl-CoA synthetase (AMP-forming)